MHIQLQKMELSSKTISSLAKKSPLFMTLYCTHQACRLSLLPLNLRVTLGMPENGTQKPKIPQQKNHP